MVKISKTDLVYSIPNRHRLLIQKNHVCMEIEKRNIFVRAIYLLRGQYNKCKIATKAVEIFAHADRIQNLSDRERNRYLNNLDAIVDRIPQTKFEELRNELHGKINSVREQCLATSQVKNINFDLKQTAKVFNRAAKFGPRAHHRYVAIEEEYAFTRIKSERRSLNEVFDRTQKQIQESLCSLTIEDIEKSQRALRKISLGTEMLRVRYKHAGNIFVRLGWIKPKEKRKTLHKADQLLNKVQVAQEILAKISEGDDDFASLKDLFTVLSKGSAGLLLKLLQNSEEGMLFETCRPILEELITESFIKQAGNYTPTEIAPCLPYLNYRQLSSAANIRLPAGENDELEPLRHLLCNRRRNFGLHDFKVRDLPIWTKIARDCGNQRLLHDVYIAETRLIHQMSVDDYRTELKSIRQMISNPPHRLHKSDLEKLQILQRTQLLKNKEFRRAANLNDPFFRDLADLEKPLRTKDFRSKAIFHALQRQTNLDHAYALLTGIYDLVRLNHSLSGGHFTEKNLVSLYGLVQKGLLEDDELLEAFGNNFPLLNALFSKNQEFEDEPNLQIVTLYYLIRILQLKDIGEAKNIWNSISELARLNKKVFGKDWEGDDYRALLKLSRSELIQDAQFVKFFGHRIPLLQTLAKQGKFQTLSTPITLEPDFKLIGNDDTEVKAILPLLAIFSLYFEAVFQNNTLETDSTFKFVLFEQFKGTTLSHITYFAETGALPANLSSDELFELKNAADYFIMPTLSHKIDEVVQFIDAPQAVAAPPIHTAFPPPRRPIIEDIPAPRYRIEHVREFLPYPPGIPMGNNMYMTFREVKRPY